MEDDTSEKFNPLKKRLCTHHVGSGRKEDRGILGNLNTARLAPWLRGFLYTDLESDLNTSFSAAAPKKQLTNWFRNGCKFVSAFLTEQILIIYTLSKFKWCVFMH